MIHEGFRARAAERPDATALIHRAGRMTYRELDRMSDGIAARLAATGVGPGNVVPVLMPPSPAFVATLLAVLKCGAAYAALDAAWPADRLRRIDTMLAAQVAVVDAGVEPDVFPRRLGDGIRHRPPVLTNGAAAMVFFTSGSTGEPKAVVSPHRGTTRLFENCAFARFDRTTVMPQAAALPWDAFALELWGVLLTGGTSVLVEERPLTPAALREMIAREGVNTLFLTTSLCHLVVEEDVAAFAGLRTLLVGGEKLSAWHADRLLIAHPEVRLVNGYGPVESTVFVLTRDVCPADVAGEIPLGRPVPGTRVYVLGEDGRECGPGEPGELCVAGDGLALGYLGDPALTAEKFAERVVGGAAVRVYRTGDLGRVDAAGVFHFHGRLDRQVKVRGHRVEPAEIEHLTAALPGVRRCVVVPVPDAASAGRALALFFSADGVSADRVRSALRAALPGYAVPDHLVEVRRFPLSTNGKVDTAALLQMLPAACAAASTSPAGASAAPAGASTAPAGASTAAAAGGDSIEDAVAVEFAAVLGHGAIARDRSFYELGGTSLAAVRLCARLGTRFGRAVPVSRLVAAPTAAGLAAWLASPHRMAPAPMPTVGARLTPMQHSFLVRHLVSGAADTENHCPLGWTITGPLRPAALAAAVQDVHRRHGYLHSRYEAEEEAVAIATDRPAEFVHLAADGLPEAGALVDAYHGKPLDLAAGVTWRAVLIRAGEDDWVFGLTVHHIAFDGWSQHRLAADLSAAYAARCRGERPAFPDEVPAPAQAVRLLAGLAEAADLPAQRRFWAAELAGVPELALPPPDELDPGMSTLDHELGTAAIAAIDRTARIHRTGRAAVLLAAVWDAVAGHTDQADFAVGLPVTRRGTAALERPVGCLIDMVCLRLHSGVGGDPLPRAAIAVARALAHADLPFAEVARTCAPGRTGRHPLYQVIAAVQDSPHPRLRLTGCRAELHDAPGTWPLAELVVELIVPDAGPPARLRVSRDPKRVAASALVGITEGTRARLGRLMRRSAPGGTGASGNPRPFAPADGEIQSDRQVRPI